MVVSQIVEQLAAERGFGVRWLDTAFRLRGAKVRRGGQIKAQSSLRTPKTGFAAQENVPNY